MKKENEENEKSSVFMGFILLKEPILDIEQAKRDIIADWDITISEKESDKDTLIFNSDEMMVTITLLPMPIPNEEAENAASTNYMWKDAVEITKTHKAQILVAILNDKKSQLEKGKLYVKICSSLLKQDNAIGIYTSGTVFEPSYYIDVTNVMRDDDIPVLIWIYIGFYGSEKGMNGYTYGMKNFDKDEIEIIDSNQGAREIHSFLLDIAYYILANDITLKDGETIGSTEEQKLTITRSKAISLPPDTETLKITF